MFKAVIFDMDDTLIQTRVVKYAAHKHAAKRFYNLELTDQDLNREWGKPFESMVIGLYKEVDTAENIIKNYYSISHEFPISAYSGALELVENLSLQFPLGLVTAANKKLMQLALTDAGIPATHFKYIQTSDDTDYHKPDPQVFLPAINFYQAKGVKKEEILYIGDSLDDMKAALGAGMKFVGIAGHTTPKDSFLANNAEVVEDFTSLLNLLS